MENILTPSKEMYNFELFQREFFNTPQKEYTIFSSPLKQVFKKFWPPHLSTTPLLLDWKWPTPKPLLSNKGPSSQTTSLKEGVKLITDDIEIASVLNKHFVNSVRCLAEKGGCSEHVHDDNDEKDLLDNIVTRFQP